MSDSILVVLCIGALPIFITAACRRCGGPAGATGELAAATSGTDGVSACVGGTRDEELKFSQHHVQEAL